MGARSRRRRRPPHPDGAGPRPARAPPTAIRGNASEILGLAGVSRGGRGVDSTDDAEAALDTAVDLSRRHGSTVAVSGPVDVIVSPAASPGSPAGAT
ncbi:hydroxyethylthiazole kinase [Tessaracoccus coleopterorum]|uniref:hydroxyethylthiazole kinase n=1 Tax=Tessaracoccus coleopterorum TaxID=2714950 RepID=UPI0038CDC9ED